MIKIKLVRLGSKRSLTFRIIAQQKQRKTSGEALDVIGYWYPGKNDVKIDKAKLKSWIDKGAQLTQGVKSLLKG